MARDNGYIMPPDWAVLPLGSRSPAPREAKPALPAVKRIEQVQLMFPVDSAHEFQWQFKDGTKSPWRAVPTRDLLKAPPGALGIIWRQKPPIEPAD